MRVKLYPIFLVTLALVMMIIAGKTHGQVRDFFNEDHSVTISTVTATLAGGYLPGRRYYLVVNETVSYDVRHATFPITQANIANNNNKGTLLYKNGGSWEDMYNVYQSSWWVIISSQGAPITSTALTGRVTYRQRY